MRPTYPPIARSARVSGIVVVDTIVDTTGRVSEARVARSIPLLDAAALDAIRQWRFEPATLDGRAVRVSTTVTVNFRLVTADAPMPPGNAPAYVSGMPVDFAVVYGYGCAPGWRTVAT